MIVILLVGLSFCLFGCQRVSGFVNQSVSQLVHQFGSKQTNAQYSLNQHHSYSASQINRLGWLLGKITNYCTQ